MINGQKKSLEFIFCSQSCVPLFCPPEHNSSLCPRRFPELQDTAAGPSQKQITQYFTLISSTS